MSANASQITSLTIVYSAVYSVTDQIKQQSSASLAFVRGIHQWPMNSPHQGPVTRKMFPFDDVVMKRPPTCWSAHPRDLWRGHWKTCHTALVLNRHLRLNNSTGCYEERYFARSEILMSFGHIFISKQSNSALLSSLSLQWRHNDRDGVSHHQPHDCLLNRLFRSKKTSKLRVTGLCAGN